MGTAPPTARKLNQHGKRLKFLLDFVGVNFQKESQMTLFQETRSVNS